MKQLISIITLLCFIIFSVRCGKTPEKPEVDGTYYKVGILVNKGEKDEGIKLTLYDGNYNLNYRGGYYSGKYTIEDTTEDEIGTIIKVYLNNCPSPYVDIGINSNAHLKSNPNASGILLKESSWF